MHPLRNQAIAKKAIHKALAIVTNLHVPEIAILGMQKTPTTEGVIQMMSGTKEVTIKAMAAMVTGKIGIDIMKEVTVMVITEATGRILTGTATRRFFSPGCFIMTGINFRILKGCSSCGLFCFHTVKVKYLCVDIYSSGNISF